MTHVLYEMEPIGVDGTLETVAALPFCSLECADAYQSRHPSETLKAGTDDDCLVGSYCENCHKLVPEAN